MSERLWTLRANVTLVLPEVPPRYDGWERDGKPGEEESYSLAYTSNDRERALSHLIALLTTLRGTVDGPEPSK